MKNYISARWKTKSTKTEGSIIKRDVIFTRIDQLRQYIKYLQDLAKEPRGSFSKEYRVFGATERFLQLDIECLLDIGNHIISRQQMGKPGSYSEIIELLGAHDILPVDFTQKIHDLPGYRNLLVHEYSRIDHGMVWDRLKGDIANFNAFISHIVDYLDSEKEDIEP